METDRTVYPRDAIADILQYEMLPVDSIVPRAYPLAKQCDPAWAADVIHIKTVCAVGCLLSSTAMALRQHGINIDGKIATPGTLNA